MEQKNNISYIFKSMAKVYYYLFALVLITLVASSLLSNHLGSLVADSPGANYILKLTLYTIVAISLFLAFWLPAKIIKDISHEIPLEEKLLAYKKSQVVRYTLFAFAGILVNIFFLLTADSNMLVILAVLLLLMVLFKPSLFKSKNDLGLSDDQTKELF